MWQQSGLNQTQYCKRNHIVLRQFKYWISKFRSKTGNDSGVVDDGGSGGHFISMTCSEMLPGISAKLIYPNGVELTGEFDFEQLRTLINL
ncbi:MAG: IS66 family insertion sequence element accessory protein TnpA [Mangrovibacterium sp.]